MLDINQVIKTVNSIITKSSDNHISGLTTTTQIKPAYNHNFKGTPKVCKMNLEICKAFYKEISKEKSTEKICPFGFTVAKKTFDISTKYNKISIFSLINFKKNERSYSELNGLPKELKKQRDDVVDELSKLSLNHQLNKEHYEYLEDLIETLLVGRIGVSIQGLSHQFFTPLQGALSDLQNIKNGDDGEESIERLEKNFDSLNKLATEVQLLLASSEEFNHNMLRRVTVHTMISEIIISLTSTAQQKNINVGQGFNHYTKTVHAIPGQLQIVLSNIIHNAIKYSFNGFPNAPLNVTISYADINGELLKISIENEGCQITREEIRDRLLFDLGYRGIHSKDRQRKGTGTGLYIADGITKTHGGKIDVESRKIGGNSDAKTDRYLNTFSIYWPYYIDEE
jgi:signal transduction histidine kinase